MNFKKLKAVTQSQTILIVGIVFLILLPTVGVPFYKSLKQKVTTSKLKVIHSQLLTSSSKSFMRTSESAGEYDVTLPLPDFMRRYFSTDMPIAADCSENKSRCWNAVQYKDLANRTYSDKFTDGYLLKNAAVLGFAKSEDNQISMILDIDGKSGDNILGRDVFIFSIYNNSQRPTLCDESVYNEIYIKNGLHYGGTDKCGIPHDVYESSKLLSSEMENGCHKKASATPSGFGAGAACLAIVKSQNWTIDKNYPW